MKVTPFLTKVLSDSLMKAKASKHEFFTPEHILYQTLQDKKICEILKDTDYRLIYQEQFMEIITKVCGVSKEMFELI